MPSFVNINRKYKFTMFTMNKATGNLTIQNKPIIKDPIHFNFSYTVAVSAINVATFNFFNLNKDTISKLSSGDSTGFILECWYEGGLVPNSSANEIIFKGLIFRTNVYRSGADLITEVVAFSSLLSPSREKVSLKFPRLSKSLDVLTKCLDALGVKANIQGADHLSLIYKSHFAVINKGLGEILKSIASDNSCLFYITADDLVFFPNFTSGKAKKAAGAEIQISTKNGLVGNIRAEGLSIQLAPVNYFQQKNLTQNLPVITVTTLLRKAALFSTVKILDGELDIYGKYKWGIFGAAYNGEYRGNTWYTTLKLAPLL